MWRLREERGSTILMVAASLLVLMGFAALAVDWGFGVNQRRADQNAADFGALGAVQKAQTQTTATCNQGNVELRAACNGAEAAMDIANQNLDLTPDWLQANCDPARPVEFTPAGGGIIAPNTDCISFTSSLDRARVKTPTIASPTFFASAFGVASVDTNAEAEAGGRSLLGGAVLPFAIPSNLAGDSYECLRSGSSLKFGPCAGGDAGNYGYADMRVYGTEEFVQSGGNYIETTTRCNDADTNGRMTWNIAAGVDHPLTAYSGGTIINDKASCPVFNAGPNQVSTQSGIGSALEKGLFEGSDDYSAASITIPGRLSRGGNQIEIKSGVFADDTPLWTYLAAGTCTGVPGVTGAVDNHQEMELCLNAWVGGSVVGIIFSTGIGDAVRFGWAIELTTPYSGCTAPQNCLIQRFRPVYLDTTWFRCNGNVGSGSCKTVHSPGEIDPSITNPTDSCSAITDPILTCGLLDATQDAAAVSAYMLQPNMLPPSLREPKAGDADQLAYNLTQ